MSLSFPLPPTGRDFVAYQRIVIDAASTRTVAAELNISQTRVRQIVRRVLDWLQQTLPEDTELTAAAQLRVARHIAADRLERYYCQANGLWEQTGEAKYANIVLKVLSAQTKLPALAGTLEALALDTIFGPLPDEPCRERPLWRSGDDDPSTPARSASEGNATPNTQPPTTPQSELRTLHSSPPPLRDCSPTLPAQRPTAATSASAAAVIPSLQTPSNDLPPTKSAARRAFLAPAHSASDNGNSTPVTELKITPQTVGLSDKKRLNRHERRRLATSK